VYTRRHLYKIKDKEKVMSSQVNEIRSQWIKYLINITEVWEKVIEAKKGKEAEHYCTRIANIIQNLKKINQQWHLENSVSERNLIPVQYNNKNSNHTFQGA
jgi:hypothetical protein